MKSYIPEGINTKPVGLKWPLIGKLLIHSYIHSFIHRTFIFSSVPHTVQGIGDSAVNNQALVPVCKDLTFLKLNQNLPPSAWKILVSTVSPGQSFLLLWAELCHSPNSHVEVLTPSTSECDLIWR